MTTEQKKLIRQANQQRKQYESSLSAADIKEQLADYRGEINTARGTIKAQQYFMNRLKKELQRRKELGTT